jgi:predicted dehydrogenase
MHAEYTFVLLKLANMLLCEKPMALTVEDCDKMIAACKQAANHYLSVIAYILNLTISKW